MQIAEEYNVAVFITNQMTADPGAAMSFQADPKKPIGGHILAHASTTRIMLKKVSVAAVRHSFYASSFTSSLL